MNPDIVIATINARYHHAALGLRYLRANLGDLEPASEIMEFTLDTRPVDIAERILARRPRIVGLGVYIWNVAESGEVAALVKAIDPRCVVVMGGPETGCFEDLPDAARDADYVISGQADIAFRELCEALLGGEVPARRLIRAGNPPLARVAMPYRLYDDEDIARRLIYVEASRGCPFKCEFCLSSLDRTAWKFDTGRFLNELAALYARGARHFKFVDRTFNLSLSTAARILEFFLELDDPSLFLHFELIPDRLPEALKHQLTRFAPGTLQFEIGVQTFNPEVQALISRRQDNAATRANLAWLRQHTHAHIHADLIFGLPGEDPASFAAGFDALYRLRPHEIQVGILKRLRGTPLVRHEARFGLRFNPAPPYNILCSDRVDFGDMQRIGRFARYYDMVANSGRFVNAMELIGDGAVFARFLALSDWLYAATGRTHRIALPKLFELVLRGGVDALGLDPAALAAALAEDFRAGGFKGAPDFNGAASRRAGKTTRGHAARQGRHRAARGAASPPAEQQGQP